GIVRTRADLELDQLLRVEGAIRLEERVLGEEPIGLGLVDRDRPALGFDHQQLAAYQLVHHVARGGLLQLGREPLLELLLQALEVGLGDAVEVLLCDHSVVDASDRGRGWRGRWLAWARGEEGTLGGCRLRVRRERRAQQEAGPRRPIEQARSLRRYRRESFEHWIRAHGTP